MARVVESLTGDRMVSARPKRTTAQRLSSFADDDEDDDEEGEEGGFGGLQEHSAKKCPELAFAVTVLAAAAGARAGKSQGSLWPSSTK